MRILSQSSYAASVHVSCIETSNPQGLSLNLKFSGNTVEVVGDKTQGGKANVAHLMSPAKHSKSKYASYRGITLYSEVFGYQETFEGHGIQDGQAKLLVEKTLIGDNEGQGKQGDGDVLILSTNEEGDLDVTKLRCR